MKILVTALVLTLSLAAEAKYLKIMNYNAENFFDTLHDAGTDDWTYLPLVTKNSNPDVKVGCAKLGQQYLKECLSLDWSEAIFSKKIQNVSKVIKSYDNTGLGADIVVLEEIENKNVLSKLVSKGLAGMGYQHISLIEGDDSRGIDVGVISKYPIVSAKHHSIFINGAKLDTRGILEVTISVENQDIVVYANHWPSQNNPALHRVESARLLAQLANAKKADLILAIGDFNTLPTDQPAPFAYLNNFIDAESEARKVLANLNPGTHFYRGHWTSLDHIFIHKNSAIQAQFNRFQILNRPFLLKRDGQSGQMVPNRFNPANGEGFSDHLGMGLEFILK